MLHRFTLRPRSQRFLVGAAADPLIGLRVDKKRHARAATLIELLHFLGVLLVIPYLKLLHSHPLLD